MLAGNSSRGALGNRRAAETRRRVNHAFGEGRRESSTRQKPYWRLGTGHFLPGCGNSCRPDMVNFAGPQGAAPKRTAPGSSRFAGAVDERDGAVGRELSEERENDLRLLVCDRQGLHAELLFDLEGLQPRAFDRHVGIDKVADQLK